MKKIFIVHFNCELSLNNLKEVLLRDGYFYEEVVLKPFSKKVVELINSSSRIHGSSVLACHAINVKLIILLALMLLIRPSKVVYVVPPSREHSRGSFSFKVARYLFRAMLALMSFCGVKQLLVFTTPYEKMQLEDLIRNAKYVFLPPYSFEKLKIREPIELERPVVLFLVEDKRDVELAREALGVLGQLGLKTMFILLLLTSDIDSSACADDHRMICIYSYDYDEILKRVTIAVAKTPSLELNNAVFKSVAYSRPVIATPEHGLALCYLDTGFVVLQERWTGESLASSIVGVLNDIDEFRKKSLSISIDNLNKDFGVLVLTKFLSSEY